MVDAFLKSYQAELRAERIKKHQRSEYMLSGTFAKMVEMSISQVNMYVHSEMIKPFCTTKEGYNVFHISEAERVIKDRVPFKNPRTQKYYLPWPDNWYDEPIDY